ncbi:MAG: DUF6776 family protein [Azovibrio sp.]|uniref:DUF6776 family protein n=1 Tax=Azovibrio sp. TaxID=1872673 RepID=UPI003C75BF66
MPVAAATRKLKRFRHRFGIRAPRLAVRPHFAWYAYALGGALVALLLVAVLLLSSHYFRSSGEPDMETLQARLTQLEGQVQQGGEALTSQEMTSSANRSLSEELRILADDHAMLKDDLAYLLRLVPVGAREGEVRLDRLTVRPDPVVPHRYRFSVLVGYQSGRQPQALSGTLQFVLTVTRNGKELQLQWPERQQSTAGDYAVTTRHWLRKEGVITLAPGDQLKRVDLKLLQGKSVRAATAVTF